MRFRFVALNFRMILQSTYSVKWSLNKKKLLSVIFISQFCLTIFLFCNVTSYCFLVVQLENIYCKVPQSLMMIMMMMTMMTMTVSRKHFMKPNYKSILGYPCLCRVNEREPIGQIRQDYKCTLKGETLWGIQYRNTVRKIGKYRNTVSKIDEIPIPHL